MHTVRPPTRSEGRMCQLTGQGDGSYWAPHDEEALQLDNYAWVFLVAIPVSTLADTYWNMTVTCCSS